MVLPQAAHALLPAQTPPHQKYGQRRRRFPLQRTLLHPRTNHLVPHTRDRLHPVQLLRPHPFRRIRLYLPHRELLLSFLKTDAVPLPPLPHLQAKLERIGPVRLRRQDRHRHHRPPTHILDDLLKIGRRASANHSDGGRLHGLPLCQLLSFRCPCDRRRGADGLLPHRMRPR